MEPTDDDETKGNMAIVATFTTASLLDDGGNQPEPAALRKERERGVKARWIAASGRLWRGGRKRE